MTIEIDSATIPGFMQARFVFRLVNESINRTKAVYGEKCVRDYEEAARVEAADKMIECVFKYARSRNESILKYDYLLVETAAR